MALNLSLFLGINRYQRINPDTPLRCAVGDAKAMAAMFHDHFGYETTVFSDEEVTSDRLRDTLEAWKQRFQQQNGGRLLIYFAGHGATSDEGEPLLLTGNAAERDIARPMPGGAGVISTRWLEQETAGWPHVDRAFILDACRTQANSRPMPRGAGGRDIGRRGGRLDAVRDLVILRACQPDQIAVELTGQADAAHNHGIFTAAFLEIGQRKASIEAPLVLGPEIHGDLTRELARLAQYAPEDYREQARAQTPMREGADIALVNTDDYRALAIQRRDRQAFDNAEKSGTLDAYRFALIHQSPDSPWHENLNTLIREAEHHADEADWEEAQEKANLPAWRRYLGKHPKGRHTEDARQKIADVETKADELAWDAARQQGDKAAFERYLQQHPQGRHVPEAKAALDKLQKQADADETARRQARQEDETAWSQAKKNDDVTGYLRYLEQHPQGAHRGDAERLRDERQTERRADDMAWDKAHKEDSEEAYALYLAQQSHGAHRQDAQRLHEERKTQRLKQEEQARLKGTRAEQDLVAWQNAQASITTLRQYLERFPEGAYRAVATELLKDETAWEEAAKEDSEHAYQRYSKAHPQGRRAPQAKQKEAQHRQARQAQEGRAQEAEDARLWKEATDKGALAAYKNYLKVSKLQRYAAEARQKIALLEKQAEQATQRDKVRWEQAIAYNTINAYQSYLTLQETPAYSVEASKRLGELQSLEKQQQRDTALWRNANNLHTVAFYQEYLETSELKTHREEAKQAILQLRIKKHRVWVGIVVVWAVAAYLTGGGKKPEAESAPAPEAAAPAPAAPAAVLPPAPAAAPPTVSGITEPEMVTLSGGSFEMGSTTASNDEHPVHTVQISAFALGRTEVTVAQYTECERDGACKPPEWREPGSKYHYQTGSDDHYKKLGDALARADHPVVGVSWQDARAYAAWLTRKTGKRYRLPSEAEWEYACRSGKSTEYCGGDNAGSVGWHSENSGGRTHAVAGKQANAWGLHDMSGNVWEWVEDCYHDSYQGAPKDWSAWTTACTESRRVLRGGSWGNYPGVLRSANRNRSTPDNRDVSTGFRVARTLP